MGPPEELIVHEFYVIGQERGWQCGKSRLQEEKPVLLMPGSVVRRMTYHSRAGACERGDFRWSSPPSQQYPGIITALL